MPLDPNYELHPSTLELLSGIFPTFEPIPVSDETIEAFALGLLPPAERSRVKKALIRSDEACERLAQRLTSEMKLSEASPATLEVMAAYRDLSDWSPEAGWEGLLKSEGPVSFAVRTAFEALGKSIRSLLSPPIAFARLARQSEDVQEVAPSIFADVSAWLSLEGEFSLNFRFSQPEVGMDGRRFLVGIVSPEGPVFWIGAVLADSSGGQFHAPNFGQAFGLAGEILLASLFQIALDDLALPPTGIATRRVFVEGLDSLPLAMPLLDGPRVEGERLLLRIGVGDFVRQRWTGGSLEMWIAVGKANLSLGAQDIYAGESSLLFESPVPGLEDGEISCLAVFGGRLRRRGDA